MPISRSPRLRPTIYGRRSRRLSSLQREPIDLKLKRAIEAAQIISSEIVLEKLLDRFMRIVIANTGAQKGFLMLKRASGLQIAALMTVEPERIEVACTIPVESSQDLSLAIVQYVAQTGEAVVLHDAGRQPDFAGDSYIAARHPKSICCLPLLRRGDLSGVLYLENNLAAAAFTSDRLEVLRLLTTQAAVGLENARLYANLQQENAELEQRVQMRTTELAASETWQRLMLEQMPAILWSTDRELRITSSVGADLAGLNLRSHQLVGTSLYDYVRTDDREHPVIALCKRAIGGKSHRTRLSGRGGYS